MASLCLAVVLSAGVAACSGDDGGGGGGGGGPDGGSSGGGADASDSCAGTVPTFDQVTLFDVCTNCHSSELSGVQRQGATPGIDYDTYDAAKRNAAQGVQAVMSGLMPASGSVTEQQKQDFYTWAACGTPEGTARDRGDLAYSAAPSASLPADATSP